MVLREYGGDGKARRVRLEDGVEVRFEMAESEGGVEGVLEPLECRSSCRRDRKRHRLGYLSVQGGEGLGYICKVVNESAVRTHKPQELLDVLGAGW